MPSRANPPLRRLLLSLTLVGLLPLAAMTALSIFSAQRTHRAEVERSTRDLARAIATAVESEHSASLAMLQAIATSNEILHGDLRALHAEISRFAATRPDLRSISLADTEGRLLVRSNAPYGEVAAPVEPGSLAQVVASGRPQVGSVIAGPMGNFAYPVRVPILVDGQVRYVLTAVLRPDRIRDIMVRQDRPADWVLTVFDGAGRRVARSRNHESTLGGPPSPTLAQLLSSTDAAEGSGITQALEGDDIATAFVRLPQSGWVVAIGSPLSLLRHAWGSTLPLYLFGVGGSLVLAIPLAIQLSRRIRRNIRIVSDRAGDIGTLAQRPAGRPDIQELATLMERVDHAHARVLDAMGRAERAAAAKDQFLAVLGHELRNPLAPMANVLEILDRKEGDTRRERAILRRQVRHMTRLVDDLLDVTRLVEGKIRLQPEPLDLGQLAPQVVDTFREQDPQARIELGRGDGDLSVVADPVRLAQVLTNLLINAARHGADRPITVALERREGFVQVSVTDRGEGMTPETLDRVFDPFFQARTNAGALGLGLTIVRGIVEKHGGFVQAASEGPGRGSTFTFGLPAADPAVVGEPGPRAADDAAPAPTPNA